MSITLTSARVLCIALLTAGTPALATTSPGAIACIERYRAANDALKSYSYTLIKKEWTTTGTLMRDDVLKATFQKPTTLTMGYLNEGTTGIKNNGMRVTYNGTSHLDVKLGAPQGLGFLLNGPASLVVSGGLSTGSVHVLQGEYLTINRGGFGPLARLLASRVQDLKAAQQGGLTEEPGTCRLHYTKHTESVQIRDLRPTDSIEKIEDEVGTLAFFILMSNPDQFSGLYDVFHRSERMDVKVPLWFLDFDLILDPKLDVPNRLTFHLNDKILADYQFTDIKVER